MTLLIKLYCLVVQEAVLSAAGINRSMVLLGDEVEGFEVEESGVQEAVAAVEEG